MELFQFIVVINAAGIAFLIIINFIRAVYWVANISPVHDPDESDEVKKFYAFCRFYNRAYFCTLIISVFIIGIAWANKSPF